MPESSGDNGAYGLLLVVHGHASNNKGWRHGLLFRHGFHHLSGDIDLFSRILLALGWFVRLVGWGWAHQMAEAKWGAAPALSRRSSAMRWWERMDQIDSILQLAERGDSSFAVEHLAQGVQRDDKRHIGLAIACDIGGTVTERTGVDRHFECPTGVALSDITNQ